VMLYEALCGRRPYEGVDERETIDAIRRGQPSLPSEHRDHVPSDLEAIALTAMARDPKERYPSVRHMADEIDKFLKGRPLERRTAIVATTLSARVREQVANVEAWHKNNWIYEHELRHIIEAYHRLVRSEDDWFAESRALTRSQIALYLGAFALVCGSLFYFAAHRFYGAVEGLWQPLVVLGLPFVGLNAAGGHLYRNGQRAVAIAFLLAGVCLLPLLLLLLFHESGWLVMPPNSPDQIFGDKLSNRQLQVTIGTAWVWAGVLAVTTATGALSAVFTFMMLLFALAILGDFGLSRWLRENRFDLLALQVLPLIGVYAAAGAMAERHEHPKLPPALYIGAALTLVVALDLLALNGRAMYYLGLPLRDLQGPGVKTPHLIDTLGALTLNGAAFYGVAALVSRYGTGRMLSAERMLFTIAPFSTIQPLGYLCKTGNYSHKFDWVYLSVAVAFVFLAYGRQRLGFYYAGLLNSGVALVVIAIHRKWYDRPLWAVAIIAVGLVALVIGYLLDQKRQPSRALLSAGPRTEAERS
jgi:hypothetical protein